MPELRTLKFIVGGMTALILVMLALVIWGMSRNTAQVQEGLARLHQTATALSESWQGRLPQGRILAISPAGTHIAILAQTDTGRVVYVMDPATGRLTGTLLDAPDPGSSAPTAHTTSQQPDPTD